MILEGRGIVVRLGGRAVVDGVDLGVGAGEVVGLFGPNGAGKSTLFRALVGAIRPDAGRVTWRDEDVTAWPLHRRARAGVGYLAQRPSVIGGLSVRHNVALPTTATASSIAEALRVCGVEALADRDAGTLSGGERRRVELARCVASGARVVLLDEPFSGVDPARVGALVELIRALAARDVGVLFTDHAARDALPICDRVVVLDEGKARVSGTMEAVSRDPWVLEAYLGRHRSDRDADSRW